MNNQKTSKIKLYKENLLKFIESQNDKNFLILPNTEISEIDYIIGILFLTEMNRYCKNNKISIHGYYIAHNLINIFSKIKNKLISNNDLTYFDINQFYIGLANNVDYLNNRVDPTNPIRNKINTNLSKLIIELNTNFTFLFNYKKIHKSSKQDLLESIKQSENSSNINSITKSNVQIKSNVQVQSDTINITKMYCDIKCYNCWVENILVNFFYILLVTAKFMGSGEYKDPNLKKLAEYYSNIIYIYLKVNDTKKLNCDSDKNSDQSDKKSNEKSNEKPNEKYSFELFDNYIEYKNKLNYSLIELKINSDTVDEIINYLDNIIIKKLSINNK